MKIIIIMMMLIIKLTRVSQVENGLEGAGALEPETLGPVATLSTMNGSLR